MVDLVDDYKSDVNDNERKIPSLMDPDLSNDKDKDHDDDNGGEAMKM